MTIDLDDLKRKAAAAAAAAPGEWEQHDNGGTVCQVVSTDQNGCGTCSVLLELERRDGHKAIAEHIAAADPQTVLALVRVVEAALAIGPLDLHKRWSNMLQTDAYELIGAYEHREAFDKFDAALEPFRKEAP